MKGKGSGGGQLGRSLLKRHKFRAYSSQHTVEVENKASITEQNDLENFLTVSILAERDFTAARGEGSLVMVDDSQSHYHQSSEDTHPSSTQSKNPLADYLSIPRRPDYRNLTPQQLAQAEQQSFLHWRQQLAQVENEIHKQAALNCEVLSSSPTILASSVLTPFERNLEIWRQLWRVLEPCGLIVQVVDARNPLLFYSPDLVRYVGEEVDERHPLGSPRQHLILLNKADLLSEEQRCIWNRWLTEHNLPHLFFSALNPATNDDISFNGKEHPYTIHSPNQVLEVLQNNTPNDKVAFVGYPNVGKSSTINALFGTKRVAVAAAPGKTKHYQTLLLPNGLTLYDCPGLVFPNMASSRAELVLSGVLPIDHMRDWREPLRLLLQRIPVRLLAQSYGLLPVMEEDNETIVDDFTMKWTEEEFVALVAWLRGFHTAFHGNPDMSRAARIILKDHFRGELPYCHPPPEIAVDREACRSFNRSTFAAIARRAAQRKVCMGIVAEMERERLALDMNEEEDYVPRTSVQHGRSTKKDVLCHN